MKINNRNVEAVIEQTMVALRQLRGDRKTHASYMLPQRIEGKVMYNVLDKPIYRYDAEDTILFPKELIENQKIVTDAWLNNLFAPINKLFLAHRPATLQGDEVKIYQNEEAVAEETREAEAEETTHEEVKEDDTTPMNGDVEKIRKLIAKGKVKKAKKLLKEAKDLLAKKVYKELKNECE